MFYRNLIFISLLCMAMLSYSQTISTQKGLTTIVFNTTDAYVTVYLPDDLRNGDKVFGTFEVYNEGLTDEQLAKSLAEVRKYKFNFSNPDNQTSLMQRFINIPTNQLLNLLPLKITSALTITLTEASGKVHTATIKSIDDPILTVDSCLVPTHFLIGEPYRLIGAFDGNGTNTRVSIFNTIFRVLAESPRQCIVQIQDNFVFSDKTVLKVMEDFKPKCAQDVVPVKVKMVAEKSALKKGESINVHVIVRGLKDIALPTQLVINNLTPDIISIKNGNKQVIELNAAMFANNNEMKFDFTITASATGDFELDTHLNLPEYFPGDIEH